MSRAKNKSNRQTDKYLGTLHQGARASTRQDAKELRHSTTNAEQKLWSLIRNRQLKGKKFKRQHAVANYILDFYCNECKLAIELDGNFHTQTETKNYGELRTLSLNEQEITLLRFWNEQVLDEPERVLRKISEHL